MREDESTHFLKMTEGGLSMANTDEAGQKHTLSRGKAKRGGEYGKDG